MLMKLHKGRRVDHSSEGGLRIVASRRTLLAGGLAGSAALMPRLASAQSTPPLGVPEWTKTQGHPIASPAYGQPSEFEKDVVRQPSDLTTTRLSSWSLTPLQRLHGIITPNGLVFERHHAGVPNIDPDRHRLVVHGLADRPLIFSMDDLMRFPSVSRIYFLECSGNSLTEYTKPRETVEVTHGLLSCCEWTGVALSTLLQEAGAKPEARWVLAEGAHGAAMTRSIPADKALDDAMIAYSQNGERLRLEQGYPVRLFLPGYEGNMSIKWLRRLKLGQEPWYTREETSKYTDLMPDGKARLFTFAMKAKSVITLPSGGQQLKKPGFCEISGLAWLGRGRITKVDVSVDGGRSWQKAQLQDPVLPKCLTRFRFPWRWNNGPAVLASRAVDETGYVQPTREQLIDVRGQSSVYHYNAIQAWRVDQAGVVTNAYA